MTLGAWNETLTVGQGEVAAIALATAIILGIAWLRYLKLGRTWGRTGSGDPAPDQAPEPAPERDAP